MEVRMEKGSSFRYLAHPSVPHQGSRFSSRADFFLEENCLLCFGEVITCGRRLNGEQFAFSHYHSLTSVYYKNRLVVRDNLQLEPAVSDPMAIGQLEGFTHQASLLFIAPSMNAIATEELIECLGRGSGYCIWLYATPGAWDHGADSWLQSRAASWPA
jgi:urease accessory protein